MDEGELEPARDAPVRQRWQWISLLPMGLGAWAPIAGAVRWGVRWWIVPGVGWLALSITGFVLAGHDARVHSASTAPDGLLLVCWVGGALTSFALADENGLRLAARAPDPGDVVENRRSRAAPPPTERSRRWSVRFGLTAYGATFAAALAVALLLRAAHVHYHVGTGALIVEAFLLSSLVPLRRRYGLTPSDLGFRSTNALIGVGLVVGAVIAYLVIAGVWLSALHVHGGKAQTLIGVHHPGTVNEIIDILALSITAPVVEEVFFRGILFRCLRNRLPLWPAALIAGVLFGLVHVIGYPPISLPIKAMFGVIACLLYERTGSLWPGIALHAFVDGSAADISFAHNDWIVLGIAGVVILVVFLRALFGPPPGPTPPPYAGPPTDGGAASTVIT